MKKRLLAMILAAVFCLSLLPSAAFAEDETRSFIQVIIEPEDSGSVKGVLEEGYMPSGLPDLTAEAEEDYEFSGWYALRPFDAEHDDESSVVKVLREDEKFVIGEPLMEEYNDNPNYRPDFLKLMTQTVFDAAEESITYYIAAVFKPYVAPLPAYASVATLPAAVGNLVCDGNPHALVTEGEAENGTMAYCLDGYSWSYDVPTATDAGDYTVYYKASAYEGFVDSDYGCVYVTIDEAPEIPATVVTAPAAVENLVCDGNPHALVTEGLAENGTMAYCLDGYSWSYDVPTATDAGDYTVYYKASAYEGFVDSDYGCVYVTIDEAPEIPATVVTAPAAVENLVCDGNPHALVTEGLAENGTMVYCLDSYSWSYDIPTATDAGDYTVYYKASAYEGFTDSETGTVSVSIAEPAPARIIKSPEAEPGLTYTGSPQALVTEGLAENGTMYYSPDDVYWSGDIPTGTAAGDYPVFYKALGSGNHPDSDYTCIFVNIAKANPSYSAPTGLKAVEGNTLANVPLPQGFTWQDAESTSVGAKGNNSFLVSYTPSDTANCNIVTGIEVSIAVAQKAPDPPASVKTAPAAVANLVYSGSAQRLVTSGKAENGTMVFSLDGNGWSADIPTGTAAGSYIVYYKAAANQGFTDSAPVAVSVSIAKANPHFSAPTGLKAVEGNLLKDLILPSGFSWQDSDNTTVGRAGTNNFFVRYTPEDTDNFNTVGNISVSIAVSEKKGPAPARVVTAPSAAGNLVYSGSARKLVSPGQAENGTIVYSLDGSGWSADVPSGKNAGSYTVYFKAKGSEGHPDSGSASLSVKIAKANPSYSVPTGLTAVEGQTLSSVRLPSGFTWQDSGSTSVGRAGSRSFFVRYTPSDTSNYNTIENISVSVSVIAKMPDLPASIKVYPSAIRNLVYTGRYQPLVTPGKAENGSMRYSLNGSSWTADIPTGANAGSYTVYFKAAGYTGNADSRTAAVTVNIAKANPIFTVPAGLTAVEGQTLASIRLPAGFSWQQPGNTSVGNAGNRSFTVYYTPSDTKNYNTVSNISVSVAVTANREASDRSAAAAAAGKIEAIGEVTYTEACRARIDAAETAYNALTGNQKALLSDAYKKVLSDAVRKYADLKAQAEASAIVRYEIQEGGLTGWVKDSGQPQVFKGSGELKDFIEIRIDGKPVDSKYFFLRPGSTVIEISSEYMDQLGVGNHSIEIVWKDGTAVSTFSVAESSPANSEPSPEAPVPSPEIPEPAPTGDGFNPLPWLMLFVGSVCILSALTIFGKKKYN